MRMILKNTLESILRVLDWWENLLANIFTDGRLAISSCCWTVAELELLPAGAVGGAVGGAFSPIFLSSSASYLTIGDFPGRDFDLVFTIFLLSYSLLLLLLLQLSLELLLSFAFVVILLILDWNCLILCETSTAEHSSCSVLSMLVTVTPVDNILSPHQTPCYSRDPRLPGTTSRQTLVLSTILVSNKQRTMSVTLHSKHKIDLHIFSNVRKSNGLESWIMEWNTKPG